jgi:D-alanyl-lipoteichoic acid acyltransferase DltB (MBOAT superfamily)
VAHARDHRSRLYGKFSSMLFQSWTFLLFFLVVYAVFLAVRGTWLRIPWLLLASWVFYGWWNPLYVVLILYSTIIDYVVVVGMARAGQQRPLASYFWGGRLNPLCWVALLLSALVRCLAAIKVADHRSQRPWLVLSLGNNLGVLGLFKYRGFFIHSINSLLASMGLPYAVPALKATFLSDGVNWLLHSVGLPHTVAPLDVLPIGMSFYIFQSLTYTIDYFRGDVEREGSFLRYAAFVSLFPQLLSGPIERARNLLPQLRQTPRISRQDLADGLSLFVVGLFKKRALADFLALYVNQVYAAPSKYQAPALLLASFAFAWQIYFDFSGYTDMARGVARMLGLRLMLNFNNPYLATGLGDFWRRWHISLSSWFRDYVYIPLGGSRQGELRTYVNMALTMLISGLWHGANWTFIAWGGVHALGYGLTRRLERSPRYVQRVPRLIKQILTFGIVTLAWVFFRAESIHDALLILGRICSTFHPADPRCSLLLLALVFAVWLYQFLYESAFRRVLALGPVRVGLVVLMLLYVAIFSSSGEQAFIYFQF